MKLESKSNAILVAVAALGYFVDVYDLILFAVIRSDSLKSLGFTGQALIDNGIYLFNVQMAGMLLGGILWGVLGDKRGRLTVLFGSILMYSLANIANGFVTDLTWYSVLRFIAGIGLAGELGAGVTLVNEAMSKENRGYGTMLVVSFGPMGAVTAALMGKFFDWRTAFFVGGAMGLILLLMRIGIFESSMFKKTMSKNIKKGNFLSLFTDSKRFMTYFKCILIGIPIWYVISILITFAPEIAQKLGVVGQISGGTAIMCGYIGLSIGDVANGYLSQWMRSRKKPLLIFMLLSLICNLVYLNMHDISTTTFYAMCVLLGTFAGTWAVFVTTASEQFGTNIRATVTTTVPNFVRGAVILITLTFKSLQTSMGIINSAMVVGMVCTALAVWATINVEETFGKDLDYVE
jgi:MFS family permease